MFIIFNFLLMLLVAVYTLWRLVAALPLAFGVKMLLSALVFLLAQKTVIMRLLWPMDFATSLPAFVPMSLNFLHIFLIILFLVSVAMDIVFFLGKLVHIKKGMGHSFLTGSVLVLMTLFSVGYGTWQAIKAPTVREVSLNVSHLDDLAPDLEGFRIAQVSDIHINSTFQGERLRRIVEETNALNADLIVLTGDIVDDSVKNIREDANMLKDFKAPHGVLLIMGNHEYIRGYEEWLAAFREMGIDILLNEHRIVTRGKSALVVAGLTDRAAISRGYEAPNPYKALQDAPERAVRLVLSHQPSTFHQSVEAGADIQFSGHTHGGVAFFLKSIIARVNAGFVHGLYSLEDALLYVSAGTGLWDGFLLRLGVPSEITLFTLHGKPEEQEKEQKEETEEITKALSTG